MQTVSTKGETGSGERMEMKDEGEKRKEETEPMSLHTAL